MGLREFYQGKRVLVTGHTGFKGAWLSHILKQAGAVVTGYSLAPEGKENLFDLSRGAEGMDSHVGDIRNLDNLRHVFAQARPELVFHLAAQPLVSKGYEEPLPTYETNVLGTLHLLECVRLGTSVKSVVNVTTDKVYENQEWAWGYREEDRLGGLDPYANSKSCVELISRCYQHSWLTEKRVAISNLRAGNVIGGGDFAENRIVPDCVRAVSQGRTILIRNRDSVRPYQHVLEPLFAYLEVARAQWEEPARQGCYNIGPAPNDAVTTAQLADLFCQAWGGGACWQAPEATAAKHPALFPESRLLRLDCGKIKAELGIGPVWSVAEAVEKTVEWTKAWLSGEDVRVVMDQQLEAFQQARGSL